MDSFIWPWVTLFCFLLCIFIIRLLFCFLLFFTLLCSCRFDFCISLHRERVNLTCFFRFDQTSVLVGTEVMRDTNVANSTIPCRREYPVVHQNLPPTTGSEAQAHLPLAQFKPPPHHHLSAIHHHELNTRLSTKTPVREDTQRLQQPKNETQHGRPHNPRGLRPKSPRSLRLPPSDLLIHSSAFLEPRRSRLVPKPLHLSPALSLLLLRSRRCRISSPPLSPAWSAC